MKNFIPLLIAILVITLNPVLSQTDSLKITFDATKGGVDCRPVGANSMFMHSGVGTSASSYWDYVVGAWSNPIDTTASGDTLGKMMPTGTADKWTITINPRDYYSQAGNGPIPSGDTLFNLGMVFRNQDGTMEGKDDNCNNVLVEGINTFSPTVKNSDGSSFDGVEVEWINMSGIAALPTSISDIVAYPNPVRSTTILKYDLEERIEHLEVYVMDALGRTVATLYNGSQSAGIHTLKWNTGNVNSGVYFYALRSGASVVTKKLMVVK